MSEIFSMEVAIRAIDYFTGPLRSMVSQVTAAESKMKSINNTMRLMGKSKSEIDAINASLNRMADQKAFANIASDLQRTGMARQDVAAMEASYMRMAQYQRDMAAAQAEYAAGKDLAMSGVGNLTTSAIGAFGIFELVKKAGEFQANMTVIKDSTGASTKQMNDFSDAVMNASAKVSKFNDMEMSEIAQTLTSGGFNKIGQAQNLLLPVAKFAESQIYEHKGSDPIELTKQAIEMSHLFGHYDPKSFESFLNTFNKYSMMQPGDSTQLQQTVKYLAPTAKTMGMSESDIMALSALDNRIGLSGSHGGTNAADMILRLIPGLVGGAPSKKKTPKAWQAMEDLGFIDKKGNSKFFDKNGKVLDLNGMLSTMIADSKKMNPMQLQQKYHDIFGIQGGRAASILANPKSMEQLASMRGQLGKTKSMEQINNDLQKTPEGQLNLLKSNSMTLMLRVGQQLAISLNPAIANVNKLLGSMLKFSEAHPKVAKLIGDFALFAVGSKLAEGVIKIFLGQFKMLGAAFKMFRLTTQAGELTRFGRALSGLRSTFTTVSVGVRMFARSFGSGLMTGIRATGTALRAFGSGAMTVIRVIGQFGMSLLRLGVQAARWAIQMAADWLIAMGPVGWIIMGVTAIIAAGIIMWKTNFLGFRDMLKNVWSAIKSGAVTAWNGIKSAVTGVINWFKNLPSQMMAIGKSIIEGLAKGITGAVGTVINAVKGVGSTISSAFKSIMKINSPSKVFMAHGASIVEGLSMGIDKNSSMAHKSTVNLANGVNKSFNSKGGLALAGGGGNVEIHVHPHPNQRAEEIADMVMQKLGKSTRRMAMNTGVKLNIGGV